MTKSAKEILKMEYGTSKNFMTPQKIKIGKITKNFAYEISSGRGFDDNTIYGVSIVQLFNDTTTKRRNDLSKLFHSLQDATNYISELYLDITQCRIA